MSKFVLACSALIFNKKGEVFLQLRNNTKNFPHMWAAPGGKIELGEKIKETLTREITEEHDIVVSVGDFLQVYENIQPKMHAIYFSYVAKRITGVPKIMEPDKCSDFGWFALNKLPKPITPWTKENIRAYIASKKPL